MKTVGELARAIPDLLVEVRGDAAAAVSDVCQIAAHARPGALFFCIEGFGVDGHTFAADAVAAGAGALCVERPTGVGVPEIIVTSTRRAVGPIAAEFFGRPGNDVVLIGVTGTNGKTTTTYLLESILVADGRRAGLIGTIGARVNGEERATVGTTPEAVDLQRLLAEMRERGVDSVALEVTSHGLALNRVDGLQFDAAVFTNLSREHLGFHGTMEAYFEAKRSLFDAERCSRAAVNVDDAHGCRLLAAARIPTETFGLPPAADVRAERVRSGRRGSDFALVTPGGRTEIATALVGSFNVSNCLAATAAALQVGVDLEAVREGIAAVESVPGRFEFVDAGQPFSVVVDYAHTPAALEAVLGEARRLVDADGGRLTCVFGCGGGTDPGKRPLMGEVAQRFADRVVLTSDNPRREDPLALLEDIAVGAPGAELVEDREEAIAAALRDARPDDLIVIAGKGHETEQHLGGKVVPFDDCEVARSVLQNVATW